MMRSVVCAPRQPQLQIHLCKTIASRTIHSLFRLCLPIPVVRITKRLQGPAFGARSSACPPTFKGPATSKRYLSCPNVCRQLQTTTRASPLENIQTPHCGSLRQILDTTSGHKRSIKSMANDLEHDVQGSEGFGQSRIRTAGTKADLEGSNSLSKPALKLKVIGGHSTEILSLESSGPPSVHVVIIPGNPGIVAYYEDFIFQLSNMFARKAKITCVSHIGHTEKDWESGKLSSLQDQIEHKIAYLESLEDQELPVVLVGHSIGVHIALELLRRFPDRVTKLIGLYPFLLLNVDSSEQKLLGRSARFYPARLAFSWLAGGLGYLPRGVQAAIVRRTIGKVWDQSAVEVTTRYMLNYHVAANYVFMGATEFERFAKSDLPDWEFLRTHQKKVALVFGADDHWGPVTLADAVKKTIPTLEVVDEKEGLLHAFCCTCQGSSWIAKQVVQLLSETSAPATDVGAEYEKAK